MVRLHCCIPLLLIILLIPSVLSAKVVLVVNKDVPFNQMPKMVVKGVFTGEIKSLKGMEELIVCLQEDKKAHEEFLQQYLEMTPSQFEQAWQRLIFTGKAMEPETLSDAAEVIEFVQENPGAIGYIPLEALNDNVKAILVK